MVDGAVRDLYLQVFTMALDPDTHPDERRSAGRFLHLIAGDWATGRRQNMVGPHLGMGALIRAALDRRIDGES